MSELVCFEEAGGDCLYRRRRWPWAHGCGNGKVQLPRSFVLGRGRGDDQACEGVVMVVMACGMGVCSGEASGVCRPVQRRHIAVCRGGCSPETKRRGLECSWWRVWRAGARTEQGEGSVDDGRAATLLHRICMCAMGVHAAYGMHGARGHVLVWLVWVMD